MAHLVRRGEPAGVDLGRGNDLLQLPREQGVGKREHPQMR